MRSEFSSLVFVVGQTDFAEMKSSARIRFGAMTAQSVQRLRYGLDGQGAGVRDPVGGKIFVVSTSSGPGSGAHPACCRMGTGSFSPGTEAARPSSPATRAEVKNTWIYTSTPPCVFMA
jgi:hypothetical protein